MGMSQFACVRMLPEKWASCDSLARVPGRRWLATAWRCVVTGAAPSRARVFVLAHPSLAADGREIEGHRAASRDSLYRVAAAPSSSDIP
jgi:hypothetical protein